MFVPTDLYPYVHSYLVQCGLEKTVKRFKKEANFVPTHFDGPSLLDIFGEYKKSKTTGNLEIESGKHLKRKKKLKDDRLLADLGKIIEDSNSSLCGGARSKRKRKLSVDDEIPSENLKTDFESSKPSKKRKKMEASPLPVVNGNVENPLIPSPDIKETNPPISNMTASSNEDMKTSKQLSSDSEDSDNGGSSDASPCVNNDNNDNETISTSGTGKKKKSKGVQPTVPFQRIKENEEVDPRLLNNSFEAKKGAKGSWGERANKDLKFTKGRSFRHEKTKKKRGSYKGGLIDTTVNSIKFDSD